MTTRDLVGNQSPIQSTSVQYNQVQANLSINIKPIVSGDGHVTLDINIEVSDFLSDISETGPPPSTNRTFNSLIRVHDQDMIAIGGLEREAKSEQRTGVPLLSRIPILKFFFSSIQKSKAKTVTTFFIKPTIIY